MEIYSLKTRLTVHETGNEPMAEEKIDSKMTVALAQLASSVKLVQNLSKEISKELEENVKKLQTQLAARHRIAVADVANETAVEAIGAQGERNR